MAGAEEWEEEVPVFHPNSEEFQNLVEYIRKISPIAEKVGMCKICPPKVSRE